MAEFQTTLTEKYKDLDLAFIPHPVLGDISKHKDEYAVINSIKNLVLTNFFERPFQPNIGSNVRKLLFETVDSVTSVALQRAIEDVIKNFEPRATISKIIVDPNYDQNAFAVTLQFFIINRSTPITINFQLERLR
jgi:phage baseplate assembly protein W